MERLLLFILLLIVGSNAFGQKNNSFVSNIAGNDKKNDSLAYFIYDKAELDSFLIENAIIPVEDQNTGIRINAYVSFFVDSLSNIYSIDVSNIDVDISAHLVEKNSVDSLKAYYRHESERLLKLTNGLWVVNSLNSKNRLNIIIPFHTESFEQRKKDALKRKNYDYAGNSKKLIIYNNSDKKIYTGIDYYNLGVKKLNQNKILLAKKYFEQAILIKSDDVDSYYNMGVCYLKLNQIVRACKCWKMAQKMGDTGVQDLISKYCQ